MSIIEPRIIKQKLIESAFDLMDLHIIDWGRSWTSRGQSLAEISSWLINAAHYTILEYDLRQAPERDDWPDWHHVGNHEPLMRLFWNDFHWRFKGGLWLDDRPDFSGRFDFEDGTSKRFWGDIGQVSATVFSHWQKQLRANDLWISVLSETKQVIIEPYIDIHRWWGEEAGMYEPTYMPALIECGAMVMR